jgi:hypothetical protein
MNTKYHEESGYGLDLELLIISHLSCVVYIGTSGLLGMDDITLSNKQRMTFSKEHQIGMRRFDALSSVKVVLPLSFLAIFNLVG